MTGQCLETFDDHKRPVYAICGSPGGRFIASASGDGWMNVYDVKVCNIHLVLDGLSHRFIFSQTLKRVWGWFSGMDRPGVFEVDWQLVKEGNFTRIAAALENKRVQVFDTRYIPPLRE